MLNLSPSLTFWLLLLIFILAASVVTTCVKSVAEARYKSFKWRAKLLKEENKQLELKSKKK